jgi:hypothetical protein
MAELLKNGSTPLEGLGQIATRVPGSQLPAPVEGNLAGEVLRMGQQLLDFSIP